MFGVHGAHGTHADQAYRGLLVCGVAWLDVDADHGYCEDSGSDMGTSEDEGGGTAINETTAETDGAPELFGILFNISQSPRLMLASGGHANTGRLLGNYTTFGGRALVAD